MPVAMLLFVCPHCTEVLKVSPRHLGRRGRCNKCGGRIALIGDAERAEPQAASAVADVAEGPSPYPPKPVTEAQCRYLSVLGAAEEQVKTLDRESASALIAELKQRRGEGEAATEKQVAYLRRLGATDDQVARAASKAAASELIEAMHLHPTSEQIALLHDLGATGAQLAALKTKAAADALIESLYARGKA